jgi:hypothetical protein
MGQELGVAQTKAATGAAAHAEFAMVCEDSEGMREEKVRQSAFTETCKERIVA